MAVGGIEEKRLYNPRIPDILHGSNSANKGDDRQVPGIMGD